MVNRPYEISLWTLQDGFISILGSNELEHYRGRMSNGEIILKTDGTESFSAKIPMHIFNKEKLVDNPLWYDYKRGLLLANLRKIKVIFNKHKEDEKVYEFVIMKTEDTHGKGRESFCSVECEGLAFQELGKIGYKISLSQEDFEREYTEWFESTDPGKGEAPVATLNYWAEKIFKNTNWKVEYKMDWSYYNSDWKSDKVYEDEYVSSWDVDGNGKIIPNSIEMSKEKARMFSGEKSNIYNLSQSLAETFGVYCRYEYEYDANYCIVGRKCIFYNSFYVENEDELNITYPYDTEILTRTSESKDLVTKLYVLPIEDSNYEGGLVSIMGSDANKSKEDYILNFDYLYEVEGINEEQYNEIEPYLERMRVYNNKLDSISKTLSEIEKQLVDLRASETILSNSLSECDERCNEAVNRINSYLGNEKGVLTKDAHSPDFGYLILDNNGKYKINLTQEGISKDSIKLYLKYNALGSKLEREIILQGRASFNDDEYGNLTSISNIEIDPEEGEQIGLCYLTYDYTPILPYQNIYKTYSELRIKNEAELEKTREEIERKETSQTNYLAEYNLLLENKSKDVAAFEKMMGASLKEGYWQPENYQDYGEKRSVNVSNSSNSEVSFFYDSVAFEGEFESGYEEEVEQEYKNYPYIILNIPSDKNIKSIYNRISLFASNEENFPFINTSIYTVGSQLKYGFVGDENKLVLFIVDKSFEEKSYMELGINTSNINSNGQLGFSHHTIQTLNSSSIIFPTEENNINKYPRIKIANPLVKTNYEDLLLKSGDKVLEKYYDYTILYEESYPYITLKPETIIQYGNEYVLDYFVSNAATGIYLDALQVSKSNAFPQVSYEVSLTNREKKFNTFLWLGRLALINDYDLKLFAVQGYVSEVSLVLDKPQSDKVSIQNYKTDFEDLFSKIVASSESMKMKQAAYDRVSSAFLGGSVKLTEDSLLSTFDSSNLSMAFEKGNLKIDEANGIWGISEDGVVAYRGGGIFCASEKDQDGNYLWNTGITPKGINASLITTGQLDTNLIRIFAGNNVRLQMNSNGLIAYKLNDEKKPDPNNYVIHEGEGLFFRSRPNEESSFIDRVAISWDGLTLRNIKNKKVFFADAETGDLTITGTINATGGNIGELVVQKLIEVDYPQIEVKANNGYFFKDKAIEELNFTISGLLLDITKDTNFLFYDVIDTSKNSLEGENLIFDGTNLEIKKGILGADTKKSIAVECHKTEIVDGEEKETIYTSQIDLYLIQDGQNGSPGEPGRGIVSSVISYARTTEEVEDPSGINNWVGIIPTEGGRKLWTRTELNYTDGQKEVFYTNSVDGEKGDIGETGNGIKNITIQYTNGSPSINPEELTGWQNSPNGISLGSNEVLWTKTTIEYTNNSTPTISYTKSGEKGASGENGTSAYSAVVSSSGGDSFKTTTDWSVLYCNIYKGGVHLEGPGANLFYLNGEVIPTGAAYKNLYFYIITPNNDNPFSFYKYTDNGENYEPQSTPDFQYDYTWTRFDENGVKTAGFNKSGPMIYVSRDDINIKATYFCEVDGE